MGRRLSGGEAQVLSAVRKIGGDGWPVTIREILERTCLTSSATVHRALLKLEANGEILRHPRNPRGGWRPW